MKFDLKLQMSKKGEKKIFSKEKIQINPDKYWIFVLIFNFLIIVGAFVFGYLMFTDANIELNNEESASSKQGINEKNLEEVLNFFEIRKEKSEKIKVSLPEKVDPSI